jgi:MAP/microtubule affinity-regulating kinase
MNIAGLSKQMKFVPSNQVSEYAMRHKTAISNEDYKIGKLLGKGAYAEVRECVYMLTGVTYAAKMYDKIKLIDKQKKRNTIREIHVLEELNHCNIMHLYHVIETPKNVLLIIELIKGRSLKSLMKDHPTGITEPGYVRIFKQILQAVEYIHSRNVAHR